jgi:hypothetical protein
MQLTHVAVVILASMVFVLSGMVGYLYWQQTRMLQHLQSLAGVIAQVVRRPEPEPQPELEADDEEELPPLVPIHEVTEDDDRLSVEKVEGPPASSPAPAPTPAPVEAPPVDDLDKKTAAELRDLLTSRGIPFGKRDAKSVLLQLLKATA